MGEITKTHFSGQYLHRDRRKVSEVYFNERYRWKREDIFKKIQLMIIIVPPSLDKIDDSPFGALLYYFIQLLRHKHTRQFRALKTP